MEDGVELDQATLIERGYGYLAGFKIGFTVGLGTGLAMLGILMFAFRHCIFG